MSWKKYLVMALAMTSQSAYASTSSNGMVQGFVTLSGGVVLVYSNGTRTAPPACSNTSFTRRWAFDGTTTKGQAMLSILLTARAMNDPVSLYGTGTCSLLGDAETIDSIVTNNLQ